MVKVVGIKFLTGGRIYYFSPGKNDIKESGKKVKMVNMLLYHN